MKNIEDQLAIIKRGCAEIINEKELIDKLQKKSKLVIKLGLDPTMPDMPLIPSSGFLPLDLMLEFANTLDFLAARS